MTSPLKIGIRQLVEFCCRSGNLGFEGGPSASALEGLRTHQKIQKRYQKEAIAEHRLKLEFEIEETKIELGGRIDLLFDQESPPRVEEIKTIYSFMNSFTERYDEPHWAQVKCYAAGYAIEQNLDRVVASLNYVNLFNQQEYRQTKTFERNELEAFIHQILQQYLNWHRLIEAQRQQTMSSASSLEFPHQDFRPQQHYFASQVYRNIQRQGQLMVEAPTGSGKTISTLFPSVKAIGEDIIDQIVYLSAKTSGQNQAIAAVENMAEQGLEVSYLVIQAKAKACPCNNDDREIDSEGRCIRSIGFFDRLATARQALIQQRHLGVETLRRTADEYQLCPFELSLQMLPWVDIIIADLNYVFDPMVQLSYFKTDNQRKLLLIDELHNLVDRARSMYSAEISRRQIKLATEKNNNAEIVRALNGVNRALDKHLREQQLEQAVSDEINLPFTKAVRRFSEKLNLDIFGDKKISAETLEFAKAVYRYQTIHNLYGDHHKTISIKPLKHRQIKLLCLNAFEYLREIYPLFDSVCGFSATLTPDNYFLQALGFEAPAQTLRLESSFPQERLRVNTCSYVDTRYQQREAYIDQICATIHRCYQTRPGNYLVFFSSYYFMQQVYDRFLTRYRAVPTMQQSRDSSDGERRDFLNKFSAGEKTLGFVIMGGIFAEGIDYQGESLIGAIVVGVGLPQANNEQKLIEQDFQRLGLNGFDHAYRFPGLIRVQQSAGRVIRSENDRGIVILLDRRFQHNAYQQHYPAHWQPEHCETIDSLEQSLLEFWHQASE
ncbi:MAG: ATP-dependent DNA helicase [Gammaproteobacteria bacterium]|nr:ATP-dependent DNA helicase [Gammaproteobacteria bacterium]